MVQACLDGKRSKHDHDGLPVTDIQLLYDTQDAVKAGAKTIYFHVRDGAADETFEPEGIALPVSQLKTAFPYIQFGISTWA